VRELLRRGLVADGFEIENPRATSRAFGVLDGSGESGDPSVS
jgi:hypothetical protein